MSQECNVIRLSDDRQKLNFIGHDSNDPNTYTEITYNGETYSVVEYGNSGNRWLIINAPKTFTRLGRITLGGNDPEGNGGENGGGEPPAPSNLRLPTEAEWDTERLSWGSNNAAGAFGSPLKLSMGGYRFSDGTLFSVGSDGLYWSSTVAGTAARYLGFVSSFAVMVDLDRAFGSSVRLIVDGTFTQQQFDDNYLGETIEIEGLTYEYVYNVTTERIWLDRNLGATQVSTSSTDAASYGWLYQWGRLTDGHQIRTSTTTATLSTTDVPGNDSFITNGIGTQDWRDPQNDNLWQGVAGINNPGND